jgi:hypothetical protein
MRIYSADNDWYSDDGGSRWHRMTPADRRHREVTDQLDAIKRAVTNGSPAQMNEASRSLLQSLLDRGPRRDRT